jgi:bifunctional non-homologous end joining protein LigD
MKNQAFGWVSEDDAVALCHDPEWVMQQKFDGTRALVHVTHSGVEFRAGNEKPLKHSAAAVHFERLAAALSAVEPGTVLDCELVHYTGTLYVFDLLAHRGREIVVLPQRERRARLESLPLSDPAVPAHEARSTGDKLAMLMSVYEGEGEGVMLKHRRAPYSPGERVEHSLKVKFVKTVDAIVTARNVNGACNARLAVYENGKLREIGGVTMIGKPDARPGDVVEVAYLYATESLTLYQPRVSRTRTDKAPADCLIDQLTPVDRHLVVVP